MAGRRERGLSTAAVDDTEEYLLIAIAEGERVTDAGRIQLSNPLLRKKGRKVRVAGNLLVAPTRAENAAALDLLHEWQSEDAAYDREAWARLQGTPVAWRRWSLKRCSFGWARMPRGEWGAWFDTANGQRDLALNLGRLRLWAMW